MSSAPLKSYNVIDRHVGGTTATSPDMKAMCALMGQLDALKKATQAKQSTPKQSTSFKKRNQKPKKLPKENDTRKKGSIRDWLVAEAKKPEVVEKKRKPSHKKKVRSPEKDEFVSYYLKYGVKVPTFESIVKQCQETEEYKKTLEDNKLQPITEFPEYKAHLSGNKKIKTTQSEKLDCKHLTLEETREAVMRNMSYAAKIQSEEVRCERHVAFCRQQRGANFDQLIDLVGCDTSTERFTDEQIREMLHILVGEFGDKAQYYLVVLLPELCLKIFMQVHNMGHDEAVKYLEERRYSDDSDSD